MSLLTPTSLPQARRRKRIGGFTFIELLVVMAIIGALMVISLPIYNYYINSARLTLAYGALDTMRKTLEAYHIDHQKYPATINFTTGKDGFGQTVFPTIVVEQVQEDLHSVDSYTGGVSTYTLVVKATDDARTVLTMTPRTIQE